MSCVYAIHKLAYMCWELVISTTRPHSAAACQQAHIVEVLCYICFLFPAGWAAQCTLGVQLVMVVGRATAQAREQAATTKTMAQPSA